MSDKDLDNFKELCFRYGYVSTQYGFENEFFDISMKEIYKLTKKYEINENNLKYFKYKNDWQNWTEKEGKDHLIFLLKQLKSLINKIDDEIKKDKHLKNLILKMFRHIHKIAKKYPYLDDYDLLKLNIFLRELYDTNIGHYIVFQDEYLPQEDIYLSPQRDLLNYYIKGEILSTEVYTKQNIFDINSVIPYTLESNNKLLEVGAGSGIFSHLFKKYIDDWYIEKLNEYKAYYEKHEQNTPDKINIEYIVTDIERHEHVLNETHTVNNTIKDRKYFYHDITLYPKHGVEKINAIDAYKKYKPNILLMIYPFSYTRDFISFVLNNWDNNLRSIVIMTPDQYRDIASIVDKINESTKKEKKYYFDFCMQSSTSSFTFRNFSMYSIINSRYTCEIYTIKKLNFDC